MAVGCQSVSRPSIVIGYVGPAGFAGPRSGSRRSAKLRRGIEYSFHRVIAASRWTRADPSPFVNPFPFVSPFVIPRRRAARPFVRPPAWRPFVILFVRPTPFVWPRSPFVKPFVRPFRPFVKPLVRPFSPLVTPFVLPIPPRREPGASPFVIPRFTAGSDEAGPG